MSVVVFSPVRVDPETLRAHLTALEAQEDVWEVWHYDDNTDPESSALLADSGHLILPPLEQLPPGTGYARGADTHSWDSASVARVALIKNHAIRHFLAEEHPTHLLLVDADLILQPGTITHMVETGDPILCQVFWTKWKADGGDESPNCWDYHPTGYYNRESFERLRQPGHYEVGGLGACTLIDRDVLEAGVDFTPVVGVDYFGEDRHFCVRAAARNIPLTVCSHLPPYHVYRERDLLGLPAWMKEHGL
jgi:hypothetical protein